MKIEKYLCIDKSVVAHGGKIYSREKIESLEIPDWEEIFVPLSSAKWAIKRTPENAEVVNRWAASQFVVTPNVFVYHDKLVSYELLDGYTEIDFETFKEITGMREEKPKQLLGEKEAVHCPTLELAEKVIQIMRKNGAKPIHQADFYWEQYLDNLCFLFINNDFGYSDYNFYEENNYTIIDAEQFIKDNEQKIFTIEDVRNGKCAIENDGTVEELKRVIDEAFPTEFITGFHYDKEKFYAKATDENDWIPYDETDLPIQSVKLFLNQIEGEKEQLWEVGDFVYENWEGCPDPNTAYKITNVEDDKVFYNRTTDSWGKKNVLKLVKSRDLFSKTTTECQSGDLEEWQPKVENSFSPKWGEEVEGRFSNGSAWIPCKYCCQSTVNEFGFICEFGDGALSRAIAIRKPLSIHTFTTEQAKQDLAKLHNLNPEQIKITE